MAVLEDESAGGGPEALALEGLTDDLEDLLGVLASRADLIERQLARGNHREAKASVDAMRRTIEESRRVTAGLRSIVRRSVPATRAVDLRWLLDQLAPLFDAMAGETVRIERHVASELPALQASQLGLRRALLNLVVNAREALGDGEGSISISVDPAQRDGRDGVEIAVADDGPGIEPEILAEVTEPNVSTKVGATGLGLVTVSEVVEAGRGSLTIESEPGEGCTVTLWFPAEGSGTPSGSGSGEPVEQDQLSGS